MRQSKFSHVSSLFPLTTPDLLTPNLAAAATPVPHPWVCTSVWAAGGAPWHPHSLRVERAGMLLPRYRCGSYLSCLTAGSHSLSGSLPPRQQLLHHDSVVL